MADLVLSFIELAYLFAAALFILGLRNLNSPLTARKGNLLASIGMSIAIIATLLDRQVLNYELIAVGILIGSVLGATGARLVKMTAMPQMVGLFNGFGGGASALVAIAEFWRRLGTAQTIPLDTTVTVMAGVLIGGITLTGSLVAFSKLQGILRGAPLTFPLQQPLNASLLMVFLAGSAYLLTVEVSITLFMALVTVAFILGVLLVIPIGGADMPVVISLLNSFSGLAASAAGFILMNNALIISGALVGAAGLILTKIMTKAMNRTLTNVLFGAFGTGEAVGGSAVAAEKTVRSIDAEEAAMMLGYARSVIIVPGFGMAAAQAQHAVAELAELLESRDVDVRYAIHPVAGRMPGHMNVLLAEANVPYTKLYDMDDINPDFERADVALIVGANDVVNPAAQHDKGSPIYGMPILNADRARHVIVIKRSLSPGFSGVDNELFYQERTMMLFGHARERVAELVNEIKQL
jgi:NAD(P) transhydrogenase subunit beta